MRFMPVFACVLLTALTPSIAFSAPAPVKTAAGLISGVELSSGITAFKGVPFAAPPVGDLRWRAPQPVKAWAGVRKADAFGPVCMQGYWRSGALYSGPTKNSEDCLYLNIWAPKRGAAPLPVMVWLYGGGFTGGSGSAPVYDGEHLAKKGVVLVTLNYRLGALGLLALKELSAETPYHASGNYGYLDQIAALKWVRDNIAAFGGDPANVTIFGQSAGSMSSSVLQASPLAKGLFQRAIGESGSQMKEDSSVNDLAKAEERGAAYAKSLGAESLAALRALPADVFIKTPGQNRPIERDGYVLPDTVQNIFAAGKENAATVMTGSNSKEERTFVVRWPQPQGGDDAAAFARLYTSTKDPLAANDSILWHMWAWANANLTAGRPSYVYQFRHWPPRDGGADDRNGPIHGAEKSYVFGTVAVQHVTATKADKRLSDTMSSYWTNFARTGNPNGPGLPSWPALTRDAPKAMVFENGQAEAKPLPHGEGVAFLDAYFAKLRTQPPPAPAPITPPVADEFR